MSSRYETTFSKLRSSNRKAFIPFTMLGWPNADSCFETIKIMIDEGASALELGIAFSDPVADGPVIQAAAFETLESGFGTADALALIAKVRGYAPQIPIGILTYFNIVLAHGVDSFMEKAHQSGVDSILIADLTPDAGDDLVRAAQKAGISTVFIASPLTSAERLNTIASRSRAYIYVVSRLGITGSKEQHDDQLEHLLQRARELTPVPLCVGFGISSPQAAQNMIAIGADGVITGSKIIELLRSDSAPEYKKLKQFLQAMTIAVSQTERVGSRS